MSDAYDPVQVAWKIYDIARRHGFQLTHMQLQKLVYIAHGYYLAAFNRPLISEPITAWKYGPVIPAIYQNFKCYGGETISPETSHPSLLLPINEEQLLDTVVQAYGSFTGIQLSELTHRPNSPWSKVWHCGGSQQGNTIIPNSLIKDQYERILFGQSDGSL